MGAAANSVDDQRSVLRTHGEGSAAKRLRSDLKAVIILGGLVRQTKLSTAVGRAIMDLPVEQSRTLLDLWHDHLLALAQDIGLDTLPVRIMTNQGSAHPTIHDHHANLCLEVQEDAAGYRGTAGVLRDVTGDYNSQDLVLVINGAQLMQEPLLNITLTLADKAADVAIVGHEDGTPSGVMLLRCGSLADIPKVGYIDMKEQALPQIARTHQVSVVSRNAATGIPIRTLADYIHVLRLYHLAKNGTCTDEELFHENWQPTFGIIEQGAQIAEDANVHDSIVLRGSHVDSGAVLVQSLLCNGGIARRNTMVIDQLVAPVRNRAKASFFTDFFEAR